MRCRSWLLLTMVVGWLAGMSTVEARDYFVSATGNDASNGQGRDTAFATIQKGVNALAPGDTLQIGPGEYREFVEREKFGDPARPTTIRAEIPGTVLLRGDVPITGFRPAKDSRFTYVCDLAVTGAVQTVNELDTRRILTRKPSLAELTFTSGVFYHDRDAGQLYLTASEWEPAETHRYTATVIAAHGLSFRECAGVVIEGLHVTGFNSATPFQPLEAGGGAFGIYLTRCKACVVRDCQAYLNGCGIGVNTHISRPDRAGDPQATGDNVVERCVAWGNASPNAIGNLGGITLLEPRRDAIRDCVAYLNVGYGVNIYGGLAAAEDPINRSFMTGNLAWGNTEGDIKIKTGGDYRHKAERNVAGKSSIARRESVSQSLFLEESTPVAADTIVLVDERDLDRQREFADPDNRDYRLQATSRFRAATPADTDRGPFRFDASLRYVKPDGDDAADGLSVAKAWRTLAHAVNKLRPGETLYLEPGEYQAPDCRLTGTAEQPITIRGRGHKLPTIQGVFRLSSAAHVNLERLAFDQEVALGDGGNVTFHNCQLRSLAASSVAALRVTQCTFRDFPQFALGLQQCTSVFLQANHFDNRAGVGVQIDSRAALLYADHNHYARPAHAWQIAQQPPAASPYDAHERPIVAIDSKTAQPPRVLVAPTVHSVSARTANLEWMTSVPTTCVVAWGPTPECSNRQSFDVVRFGNFSLTGLKPATTYYFRLVSLRQPEQGSAEKSVDMTPVAFTTAADDPAPQTYFVANDGSDSADGLARSRAFRTIQHAANRVRVGDTVLIAGGMYAECVRIRVSGDRGAPITFRCVPGEKVVLTGSEGAIHQGFVVAGKSHLRFDGLYFTQHDRVRPPRDFYWNPERPGDFNLYLGQDIAITRCFTDALGEVSTPLVLGWLIDQLSIRNCVITRKMCGVDLYDCPDVAIEHNVFASPQISAFDLQNRDYILKEKYSLQGIVAYNIITDNLYKKASLNIGFFSHSNNAVRWHDNGIHMRDFRVGVNQLSVAEFKSRYEPTGMVFTDPKFAGVQPKVTAIERSLATAATDDPSIAGYVTKIREHQALHQRWPDWWFPQDLIWDAKQQIRHDFDTFFTTDPVLIERGIGLERAAFADFRFGADKP
ncbi:MAG: right-handed parallel beta-helix repeat-containing protein [Planctomycetaceae bacterium]|nr:right-handed parallel beta-helix repeat-containing protein [Planctomycetaceae bacterium]